MNPDQNNQTQPQPLQPIANQPTATEAKDYNALSVIGFMLAIVPPIGLIVCMLALGQIKKSGEKGAGLAWAGIIIALMMPMIVFFGILASISQGTGV